jgi:hypothetical protein
VAIPGKRQQRLHSVVYGAEFLSFVDLGFLRVFIFRLEKKKYFWIDGSK